MTTFTGTPVITASRVLLPFGLGCFLSFLFRTVNASSDLKWPRRLA